jgi:hypothetical protein
MGHRSVVCGEVVARSWGSCTYVTFSSDNNTQELHPVGHPSALSGECSTRFTQSRGFACLGHGPSPKPNLGAFRLLTGPHWSVFSPSPIESALERIYKDNSCSSRQHLLPHLTSRYSVTSSLAIMSAQASVTITRNVATTKLFARVPPPAFSQATHRSRCLAQLRSKHDNLEKYIYLNGLKDRDLSLFYSLLFDNMRESTPRLLLINVCFLHCACRQQEMVPILYTPTVRMQDVSSFYV